MQVTSTALSGVLVLEPTVYEDSRGFFYESFNSQTFCEASGLKEDFVQDNHSCSVKGVIRGLHYQVKTPQGKLVRAVVGSVFDVAVDLRKNSPTFGQWFGALLSAENRKQLWIPVGFAHGFAVLSDRAEVLYKTTEYYAPKHERCILWNDPSLGIDWPMEGIDPILSVKDQAGKRFEEAEVFS